MRRPRPGSIPLEYTIGHLEEFVPLGCEVRCWGERRFLRVLRGSSFQGSRLGGPGKGVTSAAMCARVVELRSLPLCERGRPLQEGKSADVVHEVHQADLCLGSYEADRAHDLAAHAGVLMAEDVLDARAHFGTSSVRLLRPLR